jgi:acyl carrier protein
MISSADVDALIFRAIEALNAEREEGDQIPISPETPLFGMNSQLDSLSFVSLISDVETSLGIDHGLTISLADDRALSRPESPYETVATLRDYVMELVREG